MIIEITALDFKGILFIARRGQGVASWCTAGHFLADAVPVYGLPGWQAIQDSPDGRAMRFTEYG